MAGNNIYQGQIQGPFNANQNIYNLIVEQCQSKPNYLSHIGIQTDIDNVQINPGALVELTVNGNTFTVEIGKTGIYEIGNTKVTAIRFKENKDNNTIIDYVAHFI